MTSSGTTNISNNGYFYILTGGTFSNSGTVNLLGNSYALYGDATTTFTNTGTINRTTGSGTATIYNLTFVNSGTVSVQTGILNLSVVGSATHSGTFAVSASAELQFSNSQANTFNGALSGAGTVHFAATYTAAQTLKGAYSVANTEIAGSTVNFNQASTQNLSNLTMSSGTLGGSANINLTGSVDLNSGTLTGSGTLTFPAGSTATLDSSYLTVTRPVINAGTIEFLSSAYFYLQAGGSFTNQATGVVDIQNNYYGFYGDGNTPVNNTGTVKRTTSFGTATIYNTKFVNTSPGKVQVQTGTLDIGIPTAVTQTGTFTVASGAVLKFSGAGTDTISGAINGDGDVTFIGYSGITTLTGTYAIDNTTVSGGTVNFNQGSAQTLKNLTMAGGTLAGTAAVNVTEVADFNSGTLAGTGVFTIVNGADATLDSSSIIVQRPFVNQGLITILNNGYLNITGGSFTNQASGTIDIQGNYYALYGSSQQTLNNAGTIKRTASSGTATIYYLTINNTGTFDLQSGTLTIQSCVFTQTAGAFHLNDAGTTLEVSGFPAVLNIQGGVFDGTGIVNGNIAVSGTGQFNPGTSPGEISITNNHTYSQTNPAVLNIDVNGTTAGFDYDRILISGAATLGGELKVNLGYSPALGDSFTILEHASRTGTFTKLTVPLARRGPRMGPLVLGHADEAHDRGACGSLPRRRRARRNRHLRHQRRARGRRARGRRTQLAQHDRQRHRLVGNGVQHHRPGRRDLHAERHDGRLRHRRSERDDELLQRHRQLLRGIGFRPRLTARRPLGRQLQRDAHGRFDQDLEAARGRELHRRTEEPAVLLQDRGPVPYRHHGRLHHPTTYCPSATVSRGAMAIFVAKALAGGGANVPTSGSVGGTPYNCVAGVAGVSLFTDVKTTDIFCKQVHYIAAQNVTGGCSGTTYCPNDTITRLGMAAFIAKALVAPAGGNAIPLSYTDPVTNLSYNCNGANIHFTDVPASNQFCKHVHFLWAKGIIGGISPTLYGPGQNVTRDAMAKFLSNAFNLLLYGPVP